VKFVAAFVSTVILSFNCPNRRESESDVGVAERRRSRLVAALLTSAKKVPVCRARPVYDGGNYEEEAPDGRNP
jgi:hypothetical protein